mmetsp:Transcript_9038/g.22342  ORF Transcript_9038/g.22342 Transcript_9038/m.22342 type:complete len:227 (-) Transcript_9038:597-1277(-)
MRARHAPHRHGPGAQHAQVESHQVARVVAVHEQRVAGAHAVHERQRRGLNALAAALPARGPARAHGRHAQGGHLAHARRRPRRQRVPPRQRAAALAAPRHDELRPAVPHHHNVRAALGHAMVRPVRVPHTARPWCQVLPPAGHHPALAHAHKPRPHARVAQACRAVPVRRLQQLQQQRLTLGASPSTWCTADGAAWCVVGRGDGHVRGAAVRLAVAPHEHVVAVGA